MTGLNRMASAFSEEEKVTLLKQYESSGLDLVSFAREHNLNPGTLRNWNFQKKTGGSVNRFTPVERKKIVEAYLSSGIQLKQFAEAWGVGSSTLQKWLIRYEQHGADGLMNGGAKSGDKRLGMKVPKTVQDEIIKIKQSDPDYGLKKIKNWMYRFRGVKVSTGTIRKTVTAEGLTLAKKPRKKKRSSEKVRRFERARPMQLWQSDITQFTLGPSSMRVYLTVFMDDHSRYIVGWRLQSRQTAELVLDAFKDACVRFGKPEEVLTDQGRQYFAWRGKSELEKVLEKEGIKHVVSRAHHPQTLGKCERFWETIGNEFWTRAKPQDLEEAKVRLKYFIDHYNHQRPHQGLDGAVPADRFFGIAEEVRAVIEKTVAENSLRLSLEELPQAPAFLIGQVGDQRIAFHGRGGGFYLTKEDLRGENNAEPSLGGKPISVGEFAINRSSDGSEITKESSRADSDEVGSKVEVPVNTSAGIVGSSDGIREGLGEANSNDNARVMGWNKDKIRSSENIGSSSGEVLANE